MATAASNPLSSGVSAELYRALIGPRSQDYYLRQFTRFDEMGKAGPSWHWMAYWATLNWLVYRRMWGRALAYLAAVAGVVLLVFGAGKVVFDYGDAAAALLTLLLMAVAFVVPAVYANAWFYTHSNAKITAALHEAKDMNEARHMLARQAGSDGRLMVIAAVNAAVLLLAYLAFNAIGDADSFAEQTSLREPPPQAAAQSGRIQDLSPPAPMLATASNTPVDLPVNLPVTTPVSAPANTGADVAMTPRASEVNATPPVLSPTPLIVSGPSEAAPAVAKPEPTPAQAVPANAMPAEPAQAVAATPAPAPMPAVQAAAAKTPARSRYPLQYVWVLQVGAFEQPANAQQVLEQLAALGLEAGAAPYQMRDGTVLMRVRLGPYESRRDADLVALRLKALSLPVLVLRQRP